MPKKPSFQFYYGDWKRDANLSKCSPATRGIWMDLICDMHDLEQAGVVMGTVDQLARSCRCSPDEMRCAIDELAVTQTSRVTESNGIITIINNRMKKQSDEKNSNKIRQQRYREKHVLPNNGENDKNITSYSSSSSSSSISNNKNNGDFLLPDDIDPGLWDEWMKLRKKKGAENTDRALDALLRTLDQIKSELGVQKNDAIKIALEKTWRGVEVEWVAKLLPTSKSNGSKKPTGKISRAVEALKNANEALPGSQSAISQDAGKTVG